MFSTIRRIIGLETDDEKLFRYNELQSEFEEVSKSLDSLADQFFIEKSLYNKRLSDQSNELIIDRINSRWSNFLNLHKQDIRKAKKQYSELNNKIQEIEKSLNGKIDQFKLFNIIKKAYKSGVLGLVDYNESLKKLTKDKVTKYADFILFNENNELLLLKRSTWEDDHQGAWVIPGGHVDLGEDFESAALRELWEESGFRPDKFKNVGNYIDDKVHIEYFQGYIHTKEQSPLLDVNESRDYCWINLDDIDDYNMIFNMKDNIKKILGLKGNKINIKKSSNINLEEVSEEDNGYILKSKLNALNKQFCDELLKLNRKKTFLIQKGFIDEANKIEEEIEKAKKDISKLNKVKKLFYRNGKLIFGTVYKKTGFEILDEEKESEAGNIDEDIEEGKTYNVVYFKGKKSISANGQAQGFGYSKKENLNYFCIVDEDGKKHWVSSKNITSIKEEDIQYKQEEEFKAIKSLGGSTGAQLVQDQFGNKFVKKTGKDKDHIHAEYQALKLYHLLGVKVPKIHKYDKDRGELYTVYLDQSIPIDPSDEFTKKKIQEDFGIDCLLANWDVVGLNYDNILHTPNGFYRVDVGGSLNKRAQGEDKQFPSKVSEIETLLDPNINPQSAKVFEGVNVQDAIKKVVQRYEAIKGYLNSQQDIDDKIKITLEYRINYLRSQIKKIDVQDELQSLNFDGRLYDIDRNYYSEDIVNFYDRLNEEMKIDEKDLEELKNWNHDFNNEVKSKDKFIKNLITNGNIKSSDDLPHLVNVAIANGVTWRELLALNLYTAGFSSSINSVVSKYIDSTTGNFNFDKSGKVKVNGFEGKSGVVSLTKVVCNAIRKLENIRDKEFFVEGLFNRGINTSHYGYKFDFEHEGINTHVMHTWGSSSAWNNVGFAPSKDTTLKIVGSGVHIDPISVYGGTSESEVLHKPFTLFKVINFMPINDKGKKEVTLMKLI